MKSELSTVKRQTFTKSGIASGQGALIAVAVTILLGLILGGAAINGLMQLNSTRTVVTQQSLQAYYVAQAGVQEALATRMVPRSNTLNFMQALPANDTPYLPQSGLVYQNLANQQGLIGVYRYLIVGGDPSRKADGTYYGIPQGPPFAIGPDTTNNARPKPRLTTFQSSPTTSPFFVISNGLTCMSAGGKTGIDQFVGSPIPQNQGANLIGVNPNCKAGYTLKEITIVSKINLESETGSLDRLNQTLIFADHKHIKLPANAFVPSVGWYNPNNPPGDFNFDNAWNHTNNTNTPAKPTQIVFFDFASSAIYQSVQLQNGSFTNVPNPVPATASIMLYFDGPIDFRSLAIKTNKQTLDDCKTSTPGNTLSNCAIQLVDMTKPPANNFYSGMLVVPIMPYLTKVLLLAPLGNNMNGGGNPYQIVLKQNIRSFSGSQNVTQSPAGNPNQTNYTIQFITQ